MFREKLPSQELEYWRKSYTPMIGKVVRNPIHSLKVCFLKNLYLVTQPNRYYFMYLTNMFS